MLIDCMERVDAYFRNMHLYHDDIVIRVRFLNKIFKAAMDKFIFYGRKNQGTEEAHRRYQYNEKERGGLHG